MMIPRFLEAPEIECRVAMVKPDWCQLLIYKNARVDMDILDETVGSENWQRKHYECKGNLFCSVGIKTADGWVWKDDAGAESNTEKEKGEASDSFKRACVNWGIGRELYTAPFIKITDVRIEKNEKGFLTVKDKFYVEKIAYNDKHQIIGLSIKNQTGKRVFVWQQS